jgi:hypothetical protein
MKFHILRMRQTSRAIQFTEKKGLSPALFRASEKLFEMNV